MRRHVVALLALGTAALLLAPACKKSVEGEKASWNANTKKVEELGTLYPGFKKPLDDRMTAAKGIFDAAQSLSEEEAAKKIAAANAALMAGFVADLDKVDKQVKSLRSKTVDAASKAGDQADQAAAKVATDAANKAIAGVETLLGQGAADEAAAGVLVKKALGDLAAAEQDLDKVVSSAKGKVEAKDKQEAEKKAADEKAQQEAEKKAAPWKCEYCGGMNDAKETNCKGCGAARSKK